MDAFFLPVAPGYRFCVFHPAASTRTRRGSILHVHPFGEEMNKSRRMTALQARAFALTGFDVLSIDLHGCGDSSGDFGDATWDLWHADVDAAWQWLAARGGGPVWLWGLRVGALLAASVAARLDGACLLLLWQPTTSGQRFVRQLFRTRLTSEAINTGASRNTTASLMGELEAGKSIEVAGYTLAPGLLVPLGRAEMPRLPAGSVVRWVEVSDSGESAESPATRAALAPWRAAGVDVRSETVAGAAFWQTQEICECLPLIESSLSLLAA